MLYVYFAPVQGDLYGCSGGTGFHVQVEIWVTGIESVHTSMVRFDDRAKFKWSGFHLFHIEIVIVQSRLRRLIRTKESYDRLDMRRLTRQINYADLEWWFPLKQGNPAVKGQATKQFYRIIFIAEEFVYMRAVSLDSLELVNLSSNLKVCFIECLHNLSKIVTFSYFR